MPNIQIQTIIFYKEDDKKFIVDDNTKSNRKILSGKLIAHLLHATQEY